MKTKKTAKRTESKQPTPPKAISADAVEKMAKWNKKYPEDTFSWIVIADDTPTAQKSCRGCKKEFAIGRVTRLTSKGTFCGPRCQRAAK